MVVQLSIPLGHADDLLNLGFSRIEVWCSQDSGNTYQEVTASATLPAILDSILPSNTFQMGGRMLRLQVNEGAEVPITFSTIVPLWTSSQVANRINEVIPDLASVVSGKVRLTSPTVGRASSVSINYCDAPDLGWHELPLVRGREARIPIITGVLSYNFFDLAGRTNYRYRWRWSADGLPPISDFSPYVLGKEPASITSDSLSMATGKFIGLDGKPLKHRFLVSMVTPPQNLLGFIVSSPLTKVFETDDDGFLQMPLVRGSRVRIAIDNTSIVREIVVPDSASFDLLSTMAAAPDAFGVQAPLPLLIRRSI